MAQTNLTYTQAINLLNSLDYPTIDELIDIVKRTHATVNGVDSSKAVTLFYGDKVGDFKSGDIAKAMVNQVATEFITLGNTEVGKLLATDVFRDQQ